MGAETRHVSSIGLPFSTSDDAIRQFCALMVLLLRGIPKCHDSPLHSRVSFQRREMS